MQSLASAWSRHGPRRRILDVIIFLFLLFAFRKGIRLCERLFNNLRDMWTLWEVQKKLRQQDPLFRVQMDGKFTSLRQLLDEQKVALWEIWMNKMGFREQSPIRAYIHKLMNDNRHVFEKIAKAFCDISKNDTKPKAVSLDGLVRFSQSLGGYIHILNRGAGTKTSMSKVEDADLQWLRDHHENLFKDARYSELIAFLQMVVLRRVVKTLFQTLSSSTKGGQSRMDMALATLRGGLKEHLVVEVQVRDPYGELLRVRTVAPKTAVSNNSALVTQSAVGPAMSNIVEEEEEEEGD